MTPPLRAAVELLDAENYTFVLQTPTALYCSRLRGVAPLMNLLEAGKDLSGGVLADRAAGKALAMLVKKAGLKEVYFRMLSAPAQQFLEENGIPYLYETLVPTILNRKGDGPCPFEAAVLAFEDAEAGYDRIRRLSMQMGLLDAGIL
ncbi:MAG: DUF1893 domain-containing protein [Clostridiales bacterium]|jgi:hypothetical protein|nr:DUF1893 domain-containing protein [Clostridiales bacterium]